MQKGEYCHATSNQSLDGSEVLQEITAQGLDIDQAWC